jgi:hypothetical protein
MLGDFSLRFSESKSQIGLGCKPSRLQSSFGEKHLNYNLPAVVNR